MRLKKTVALALVTAMAATMAAGCGSSSSDKGFSGTQSTAAGSEAAGGEADSKETEKGAASGGKQKLTVSVWDNDATPQFAPSVTKAFMENIRMWKWSILTPLLMSTQTRVTVMLAEAAMLTGRDFHKGYREPGYHEGQGTDSEPG